MAVNGVDGGQRLVEQAQQQSTAAAGKSQEAALGVVNSIVSGAGKMAEASARPQPNGSRTAGATDAASSQGAIGQSRLNQS